MPLWVGSSRHARRTHYCSEGKGNLSRKLCGIILQSAWAVRSNNPARSAATFCADPAFRALRRVFAARPRQSDLMDRSSARFAGLWWRQPYCHPTREPAPCSRSLHSPNELMDASHVLAAANANGAAFDPNGPGVEFEQMPLVSPTVIDIIQLAGPSPRTIRHQGV